MKVENHSKNHTGRVAVGDVVHFIESDKYYLCMTINGRLILQNFDGIGRANGTFATLSGLNDALQDSDYVVYPAKYYDLALVNSKGEK